MCRSLNLDDAGTEVILKAREFEPPTTRRGLLPVQSLVCCFTKLLVALALQQSSCFKSLTSIKVVVRTKAGQSTTYQCEHQRFGSATPFSQV